MSSRSNNDDDERKPPAVVITIDDESDGENIVAKGEKTPAQIRAIVTRVLQMQTSAVAKKHVFHRFFKEDGSEWFRIHDLNNYKVSDELPIYFLENPKKLLYFDPGTNHRKICLSFPQDDTVVLNALSEYFKSRFSKPNMDEIPRFFHTRVQFGNWSKFRERNKKAINLLFSEAQNRRYPSDLVGMGSTETARRAMRTHENPLVRIPGADPRGFESVRATMRMASDRRPPAFRQGNDRQAATFLGLATEQRKAGAQGFEHVPGNIQPLSDRHLQTSHGSNDRQVDVFRDLTTEQRQAGERQAEMFRNLTTEQAATFRNLSTEQRLSNDKNLAAILANQQAERDQNAKNLKMIADSHTKQLRMLAKSFRSMTVPQGGSPSIVHAATERKASRVPATPANINPRRLVATPANIQVVKRVLKDGCCLPTNQRGAECGHCRKAWEKRYTFCAHHETLLGERSEVE